ncbi:hypothetical protein LCGC14_2185100, partial [marine sediment metagenome]
MGNVPTIICKRLCTHNMYSTCIKPREWRAIPDNAPWNGHYCVDRLPETCKDFEFIIINDCSTDGSLKMIKEYMEKDKRIVLINNRKNIGVASSRSKG